MERTCDGCTKCCEGWLLADIKGESIFPGNPCKFAQIGVGCATYKTRPKEPCRNFKCSWLQDPTIPEWLAPKFSNTIITHRSAKGIPYVELVATGQPISENVLTWFFLWGLKTSGNIKWVNQYGQSHYYGSNKFASAMKST